MTKAATHCACSKWAPLSSCAALWTLNALKSPLRYSTLYLSATSKTPTTRLPIWFPITAASSTDTTFKTLSTPKACSTCWICTSWQTTSMRANWRLKLWPPASYNGFWTGNGLKRLLAFGVSRVLILVLEKVAGRLDQDGGKFHSRGGRFGDFETGRSQPVRPSSGLDPFARSLGLLLHFLRLLVNSNMSEPCLVRLKFHL